MLDVVLFYPKLETVKPRLSPMSVLSVAAPLVAEGYKVKIIDQRVDDDWRSTLLQSLKEKPLLVGFSSMTGQQILYALEATKLVKKNSKIPTVWGGVHPSLLPIQTLENPFINFVVIGEGERPFLELVNTLKRGKSYENINGLAYKKDGKIHIRPQLEFANMDELPETPYHLINIEDYIQPISFASGKSGRSIDFYTSRGCPHRCAFCYNQEFNKRRWRGMSAEKVVQKIKEMVRKYNITSLDIEDDEFFVDMERARRICEFLIKEGIKVEIFTTCRVNYVAQKMNDKILELCKKAGFKTLAFGVESGSPEIQKMISKDITNEQVFDTIDKLKKADIGSKYYFMAGIPGEKIEDLYATTDLMQKMKQADKGIRIPYWRVFTPYPGTELYNVSIESGFKPPRTLGGWATYDFKTVQMPWISRKMKMIIKSIIYAINYLELENESSKSFYFKLSRFYGRLIDFRWARHWFYFPEKFLVDLFLKIKHKIYA